MNVRDRNLLLCGLLTVLSVATGPAPARAETLGAEEAGSLVSGTARAGAAVRGQGPSVSCSTASEDTAPACPSYWFQALEQARHSRIWDSAKEDCPATPGHGAFRDSSELSSFLSEATRIRPPAGPAKFLSPGACASQEQSLAKAGVLGAPLSADDRNLLVADYYEQMALLRQKALGALSSVASIDSLVGKSGPGGVFRGWDCSRQTPLFSEVAELCRSIQSGCRVQEPAGDGLEKLAWETRDSIYQLQQWKDEKRILALARPNIRDKKTGQLRPMTDEERKLKGDVLDAATAMTLERYPWLKEGSLFRQVYTTPESAKEALRQELEHDRADALSDLIRFRTASECLSGTRSGEGCTPEALKKTLRKEAPSKPVFEVRASQERLDDVRAYMKRASCERDSIEAQETKNRLLLHTGGTVVLSLAGAGLGALGEGGMLLRAGHAAVSLGFLANSLPAAVEACGSPENQSDGVLSRLGGNLVLSNGSCPKSGAYEGSVSRIGETENCYLASAFAAIDAVPLVPHFVRAARAVREAASTAPITRLNIGQGAASAAGAIQDARSANIFRINATSKLGPQARLEAAEDLLHRAFMPGSPQAKAIQEAHEVGAGEKGLNGGPAGILDVKTGTLNYTPAQIRRKAEILKKAGFSDAEIRKLMDEGIVGGIPGPTPGKPPPGWTQTPSEAPILDMTPERRARIQSGINLNDRDRLRAISTVVGEPVLADSDLAKAIMRVQALPEGEIAKKRMILKKAGLSDDQIRRLWEEGLVGRPRGTELRQADATLALAREEDKAVASASNIPATDVHFKAETVLEGPPPPKPDPLPFTGVKQASERRQSGDHVRALIDGKKLRPGTYDYIITDTEDAYAAERYPNTSSSNRREIGTYNTHRSVLNRLRFTQAGKPARVIAAGEFEVVEVIKPDGSTELAVSDVSNRSGSFRGGEDRLKYATRRLADLGLPIQGKTRMRAIGTNQLEAVHGKVRELAALHARYRNSPGVPRVIELKAQLARYYPDPSGMPGRFDENAVMAFFRERSRALIVKENLTREENAFVFIGMWLTNLNKEDPYWFYEYTTRGKVVAPLEMGEKWLEEVFAAAKARPGSP